MTLSWKYETEFGPKDSKRIHILSPNFPFLFSYFTNDYFYIDYTYQEHEPTTIFTITHLNGWPPPHAS